MFFWLQTTRYFHIEQNTVLHLLFLLVMNVDPNCLTSPWIKDVCSGVSYLSAEKVIISDYYHCGPLDPVKNRQGRP